MGVKCAQHLAGGGNFPPAPLWNKSILTDTLKQMDPNTIFLYRIYLVLLSLSTGKTDLLLEK